MIEGGSERLALAGDLREISFADVVQLFSQSRLTAVMVIEGPASGDDPGYFYFQRGELYDAHLGDADGVDAVYRGLQLREGSFHVVGDVRAQRRRIFKPVGAILLEGIRRLDEARRAAAHGGTQPLMLLPPPWREDGAQPEEGMMENAEATPAPVQVPSPRRRPRLAGRWVAIASGLAAIAALGILGLIRTGVLVSTAEPAAAPPKIVESAADLAPPPAAAPAADPVRVRGVTDKQVVFGMAAPLTGMTRELGRQMRLGVETAFQAANLAGGVHGRQLRLVALDDGYEPTRTATAMKELLEKAQVFGIVGNVGTPTAAVAVPFALEHRMLFYGAFTGAGILRRDPPDRYVINYRASYAEETAAVVNYLVRVRRLRPHQIAVFAQRDSYGDAGFAGVARAMRGLRTDRDPILRVGYARNTIDVAEAVDQIVEHPIPIKAVVMVGTYRACAKFIERMRDIKRKMIFTNVSFVGSTALAEELRLLGPRYAEGVIVTQVVPPVESHSTAVLRYKAALEKHVPGETPDYVSLEGYLAGLVLIEALQRAGRDVDTERLIDTFESIRDLDLGIGTPISFGLTEHQGSHRVWGTQLDAQGRYQVLDLE